MHTNVRIDTLDPYDIDEWPDCGGSITETGDLWITDAEETIVATYSADQWVSFETMNTPPPVGEGQ